MTARIHPAPESHGPAGDPVHLTGDNIDRVDQLSSMTLLGLALGGVVAVVAIFSLIG